MRKKKKMNKYFVDIRFTGNYRETIEADSKEEAEDIANHNFESALVSELKIGSYSSECYLEED